MKTGDKYLPAHLVRSELTRHLNETYHSQSAVKIETAVRLYNTHWSTIYICSARHAAYSGQYVVKIPRLPDQASSADSWRLAELRERGWREYNSIARIYNHFSAQGNNALQALRPEAYLPRINAVVMNFIPSGTLYETTLRLHHLLSSDGRQKALQRLHSTGQWLGWLHNLPTDNVDQAQISGVSAAYTALLAYAQELAGYTRGPLNIPEWQSTLDILRQASGSSPVWIHGDFHLSNILVLPNDTILSLDTVLNTVDDPCADIGKLIVDLQTRRERLILQGMFPSGAFIQQLITAFLAGYTTWAAPIPPLTLALYEGVYLLEKWLQCHQTVEAQLSPIFRRAIMPPVSQNINQVLGRMVKDWAARVQCLAA